MIKQEGGENEGLRRITFYGEGVSQLLKEDVKLLTLRKPNAKYDLNVGEVVEGWCPDSVESVRLVVIDNVKKPLKDFSDVELLLDGYTSVRQAEDDLKQYPGYEELTRESEMQGVVTMTEEKFMSLSESERSTLLEFGIDTALDVDQPFRDIFWPAWCRWVIGNGGGAFEWRKFLEVNDLVYYNETSDEYDWMGAAELLTIWEEPGSWLYRQIVMMEAGLQP